MNHDLYMRRAFDLAKLGAGKVAPNPMVGCVIVHDNQIVGEGYHMKYGGPHAEVNAINSIAEHNRHLLTSSSLYVSLEPCHHFGKTPPCVNLVLKHKIPRVFISCKDVNPLVAGKSIEKLKAHDVEVTSGVLEEEGRLLLKRFETFFQKKRPYIILKFAQSKDGFLGKVGEQVWLTGKMAKRLVHKWRSEDAAILVGTTTAEVDDPSLTTREWSGDSPTRLVIDRSLRLGKKLKVLNGNVPTIVFYDKNKLVTSTHTVKGNFPPKYVPLDFSQSILSEMMTYLYNNKILSVLVEGGAKLLESIIASGLWDEARIFTADVVLGDGIAAPRVSGQVFEEETIGEDKLLVLKNRFG